MTESPPVCDVAVLFLIFNRPEHTAASLARIRQARPPRLYIHCDGPRADRPGEAEAVMATRRVAEQTDWPCEVFTLYRAENMGLRKGVKGAIDWFFQHEPYGIIIEDDCLPDASFFHFCSALLRKYEHDSRIMHIGGSNLAQRHTSGLPSSYFFTRFSMVWGWASWRRAWQHTDPDFKALDRFTSSGAIRGLVASLPAQAYMLDKFNTTRAGRNQSWAYSWFYSILQQGGLCLLPTVNLVQNTGIGDTTATHTTARDKKAELEASSVTFPLSVPASDEPVPEIELQLFYHTQKRRWRLYLWYILHLIGLR